MYRSQLTSSSLLKIWADNSSSSSRCSLDWRSCRWRRAYSRWQKAWTPRTGQRWRAVHISWRVPVAMWVQVAFIIAVITYRMVSRRTTTRRWSHTIHYSSSHVSSSNASQERILPREIVSFLFHNCSNLRSYYSLHSSDNTQIFHLSPFIFVFYRKWNPVRRKRICSNSLLGRWI